MRSLGEMFKEQMTKVEKAEFNQLSEPQYREVRLRFFLSLMEEGGKKGSGSFLSNVGKAGRDALDHKRVITNQNNTNEQKRYAMDAKRIFDEMKFEVDDRQNDRMKKRWEASLERVKAGYLKVIKNKDGNMEVIDASDTSKPGKPVTDSQGRPVPADKDKAGSGSEPKEIAVLRQYLSPEDFKDRGKFQQAYDKLFGQKATGGRTGKDETVIPADTLFKAYNEEMKPGDYDAAPKDSKAVEEMIRNRARVSREISQGKDPQQAQGVTGGTTAHGKWYNGLSPDGQKEARRLQNEYESMITGLPESRRKKIKAQFAEDLKRLK